MVSNSQVINLERDLAKLRISLEEGTGNKSEIQQVHTIIVPSMARGMLDKWLLPNSEEVSSVEFRARVIPAKTVHFVVALKSEPISYGLHCHVLSAHPLLVQACTLPVSASYFVPHVLPGFMW